MIDLGEVRFTLSANASALVSGLSEAMGALEDFASAQDKTGADAEKSLKRLQDAMQGIGGSAAGVQAPVKSMSDSSTAAFAMMAAAAYKGFTTIVGAVNMGIEAYNRYVSAVKGLQSVASFKGIASSGLQDALAGLEDQFFNTAAASLALKNLLSRGYSLEQAVTTINRLKDAAAYGRQASLSFADAVVSATEGIKNENSILVDNAGVTKNVSKMWEDYAASIGVSTANLTQAQKIEAEYQGILTETAGQVGNCADAAQTLAGAQAATDLATTKLAESFGSAMAPSIQLVNQLFAGFLNTIKDFVSACPGVAAGATTATLAITGLLVAQKAAAALTALKAAIAAAATGAGRLLSTLSLTNPIVLGIVVALGVAATAYTNYQKAQEKAREEAEALKAVEQEKVRNAEALVSALTALGKEYRTLGGKETKTYRDKVRMKEIELELADSYGITAGKIATAAGGHDEVTEAINREIEANKELIEVNRLAGLKENAEKASDAFKNAAAEYKDSVDEYADALKTIRESQTYNERTGQMNEAFLEPATDAAYNKRIDENGKALAAAWKDSIIASLMASGAEIGKAQSIVLDGVMQQMVDSHAPGALMDQAFTNEMSKIAQGLYHSTALQDAVSALDAVKEKIVSGVAPTDADKSAMLKAWNDFGTALAPALHDMGMDSMEAAKFTDSERVSLIEQMFGAGMFDTSAFVPYMNSVNDLFSSLGKAADETKSISSVLGDGFSSADAATRLKTMASSVDAVKESYKDAADEIADAQAKVAESMSLKAAINTYDESKSFAEQSDIVKDAVKDLGEAVGAPIRNFQEFKAAVSDFDKVLGEDHEQYMTAKDGYKEMGETITQTISSLEAAKSQYADDPAFVEAADKEIAALNDLDVKTAEMIYKNMQLKLYNEKVSRGLITLSKDTKTASKSAQDYQKILTSLSSKKKTLDRAMTDVDAWKQQGDAAGDLRDVLSKYPEIFTDAGMSYDEAAQKMALSGQDIDRQLAGVTSDIQSQIDEVNSEIDNITLNPQVSGSANVAVDLAALYAKRDELLALLSDLQALGANVGRGGGGGGGGGGGNSKYQKDIAKMEHQAKLEQLSTQQQLDFLLGLQKKYKKLKEDDARDLAERLHDIREQLREEQYQADMDLYEHQKAMGELTVAEEIEALEAIKAAHKLTNEELWDMDERLYELRKRQNEEALEAQKNGVTGLYDAVLSALQKRYEKERELAKSALSARLDELSQQQDAEDEARAQRDYAETVADLSRQLRVEKSARRRREIQKQLDDAIREEQERQDDLARQGQIDEVNAAIDAVDKKYDALVEEENLRQEALRLCMSGNLEQLSALIEGYGPKLENAGTALMEYLTEGVSSGGSGLLSTLQGVFDGIAERTNAQIRQMAGATVGTASGGTVNVYVNEINEASDADAVIRKIGDAVRSAERG